VALLQLVAQASESPAEKAPANCTVLATPTTMLRGLTDATVIGLVTVGLQQTQAWYSLHGAVLEFCVLKYNAPFPCCHQQPGGRSVTACWLASTAPM